MTYSKVLMYALITLMATSTPVLAEAIPFEEGWLFFELNDTDHNKVGGLIGVQSNANRERDFKHGKTSHFIMIGLLLGLVFICTLVAVVQIVLKFTGAG